MNRPGALALLAVLAGGTFAAPAPAAEPDPKLALQAALVLKKCCARCHGPGGTNEGGMNYILDPRKLIEKKKVVPGNPAQSRLYKKVVEDEMPPEDEKPRPSKEEVAVLERWVRAGAPAVAPVMVARPFKGHRDVLAALRDHLRQRDRDDRPFYRYFTLTHLHNNPAVGEADLRLYRAALSKVVNSLSWKKGVVVPEAVDREQTVFAVDLRKLDWDRCHLWTEVLKAYPYGLKFDHDPDQAVRDLAREVYEWAGTDLPLVRADWFVATASRPPLYHHLLYETLLRLPRDMTARDLERKLGVYVADNFKRDKLARAGFTASGVSGQNRMVERHESPYGAYWKSYDFKSNAGRGNLFRFPLGPAFAGNPYADQAFVHDGGAIIFNLPNGLQGYLLVNGKDGRIDEGPVEVVSDSLKTSGTVKIVNGLSCMACHKHGMVSDFKDTIRAGSALLGDARDKMNRLYVKPEAMARLVAEDTGRFVAALDRAAGPFLKVGADRDKDVKDFAEPVGAVARPYLLREVGAALAAYELGLPDARRLQGAIDSSERLRELGLGPLSRGGTIKREVWESLSGLISPYQEAAGVLEVGTPKRVR
jgi:serine/threonine-protein kinase